MKDKIAIKSKGIKWELIFTILDIHNYLNMKTNLEVSIINKLLREKYKKIIFKNLVYLKLDNAMNSHYQLLKGIRLISSSNDSDDYFNFKVTNVDPFVSKVIEEISTYSAYFTSLCLSGLNNICYYFIPSIGTFNNLTRLKIKSCNVSVKDFSTLMIKLNKLECLELENLTFIKAKYEGHTDKNIVLPLSLRELALDLSNIIVSNLPSNPYEFLYGSTIIAGTEFFYLAQHLPNLRSLKLTAMISIMTNTNRCLILNPQLTHLSLPIENINMETIEILSKSKVKHLDLHLIHYFTIPLIQSERYSLRSVTSLTIQALKQVDYPTLKKLLPLFSNLSRLRVKMKGYSVEYLTEILENIHKLEVIIVDINDYVTEDIDLTMCHSVNHVKIQILDSSKIMYKFPSPSTNLKSVTISTDMQYLKTYNYMKEKYMGNSDWSINLIHKTISCTRLDTCE